MMEEKPQHHAGLHLPEEQQVIHPHRIRDRECPVKCYVINGNGVLRIACSDGIKDILCAA